MSDASPEGLFLRFFWPLYPPDARADLVRARNADANPGKNDRLVHQVFEVADVFAKMVRQVLDVDLALDRSDASVHRVSRAVTRERRDAWISQGEPGTPQSELFNVVVHGTAYVIACIADRHGGEILLRRPLWETRVRLVSRAGTAELAPFQWWLKSLADGAHASLADRYRAHVEVPTLRPEDLPVLVDPARRIPRLAKVTYATLHQHLRAHAPELKDLGPDFPSAERFAELGFRWVELVPVGAGRMLLLFGLGKNGVHLIWLGPSGFEKGAHLSADPEPAPLLTQEGDKLAVRAHASGRPVLHEMLWWGP